MQIDSEILGLLDQQEISTDPSGEILEDYFYDSVFNKTDFDPSDLLDDRRKILVVTPEKLLYVLRHTHKLALHIGLLIFDEGHQFDNGSRGITYELLLTSLRSILPKETQKVLISAVISNPEAVGQWLNGDTNVVKGGNLNPTFRSVGFVSWRTQLGKIEYVDSQNPEKIEFFVPRVIDSFNLGKKGKDRFFPKKPEGNEIALYLGLKLAPNGSIAIFCGTIPTVNSICKIAVDMIDRGIPLPLPQELSDKKEVELLYNLHVENLGSEAKASISAKHGIFAHHGNMPYGIRLSIEHAMRENLVRFVICTSTLAQGVNLPIRYLIVTGVYQGVEQIKVRDFHNLIGRAGRAGMYTEGSILFADPAIYDKKQDRKGLSRWEICKKLLDPTKSEKCDSSLLQLMPLEILNDQSKSKDRKRHSLIVDILVFAKAHVNGWSSLNELIVDLERQHKINGFTVDRITAQFQHFSNVLSSIEGFLLSSWDIGLSEEEIVNLARQTLAYSLADNEKKEIIESLFKFLAKNISETIASSNRRKAFSKTLYGVNDAKAIEEWVHSEINNLVSVTNMDEFLYLIWPLMTVYIRNRAFNKFDQKDSLKMIVQGWASGVSFQKLLRIALESKCKLNSERRPRKITIENVVDICEQGFAYEGALLVSALCEFMPPEQEVAEKLRNRLQFFQKCLKYGLPTATSVTIYEIGFSDRVIAQDLEKSLNIELANRKDVINIFKQKRDIAISMIAKYPTYFKDKMDTLLAS